MDGRSMNNPFMSMTNSPSLPYDHAASAFRLRDAEYLGLCRNLRFVEWLREVVAEAQEFGISLESYSKMLTSSVALSKTRSWIEYHDFVVALVWLHSGNEPTKGETTCER
jgi:hypothetical protein